MIENASFRKRDIRQHEKKKIANETSRPFFFFSFCLFVCAHHQVATIMNEYDYHEQEVKQLLE